MRQLRNGSIIVFVIIALIFAHLHLRKTNTTYNYAFSPSDLYTHLAESSFDLSATGLTKDLKIIHQYPGMHWVALLVEKPVDAGVVYDADFKVLISILNENETLFEQTVSDSSAWFRGSSEYGGFTLMNYKIPSELLLGVPLSAKITVLKGSAEFSKKYGSQRIIISKTSDK